MPIQTMSLIFSTLAHFSTFFPIFFFSVSMAGVVKVAIMVAITALEVAVEDPAMVEAEEKVRKVSNFPANYDTEFSTLNYLVSLRGFCF